MKKFLIVDDSNSWLRHHASVINFLYGADADITLADSANEANAILYQNNCVPYDIVITDMQMESDYAPLYAGEWLIEQIQKLPECKNTKIIIISATPTIRLIAEKYKVDYIPKYNCKTIDAYKKVIDLL